MEIINNMTERLRANDMLSHIILSALSKLSEKTMEKITKEYRNKEAELRIDFKINDVEVSIIPFAEHLEKEMERMIEQKAGELIIEKHLEVANELNDEIDKIKHLLVDKIKKVFPNYNEDEY